MHAGPYKPFFISQRGKEMGVRMTIADLHNSWMVQVIVMIVRYDYSYNIYGVSAWF